MGKALAFAVVLWGGSLTFATLDQQARGWKAPPIFATLNQAVRSAINARHRQTLASAGLESPAYPRHVGSANVGLESPAYRGMGKAKEGGQD
jgi:hypothetical protein